MEAIEDPDYDCRAKTAFREHDNWAYYNIPVLGDKALITGRSATTLPCARLELPRDDPGVSFAPKTGNKTRGRDRTVSSSAHRPRARSRRL